MLCMKLSEYVDYKIKNLHEEGTSLQHEAFLIFLQLGTVGAFFGLIMTITNAQWNSFPMTLLTFLVCLVTCFLSRKIKNKNHIIVPIVSLLGCVLFPIMYVTSGGMDSAMFIWFIFIVGFTSIVLDGKVRIIVCLLQVVLNIGATAVAYKHPEVVTGFMELKERYAAITTALIATIAALSAVSLYIISGFEKANEELEKAKNDADTATQSKSMFLAAMSHEIRTPLNAIIHLNDDIIASSSLSDIKENAQDVQYSASVLSGIINDVLDFSKIEQGKFSINETEYSTKQLMDYFDMFAINASNKGLEYEVKESHHNPLPLGFKGDDIRIKQIAYNLVSNAIKYSDDGKVTVNLSYIPDQMGEYDGWLKISVQDNGIGVKETDIPHLFEAFERVDLERNNHIQGTGLGLAITKSLVDLMHGMITVSSVYGIGTTFIVSIPQKMGEATEEDVKEKTYDFSGVKILACDDNQLNLTVFSKIFETVNADVVEVESGEKALEFLKDNKVDLIYMDYRMQNMDGRECMERIREMGINTPVIAVTADVVDNPYERYMKMGFDDFVAKPIDRKELFRVTENILGL